MFTDHDCKGIFIDNNFNDVQLLMFADDICIINDTVGRLQKQLNVLELFCNNYGLTVNLSKTNSMVFRNGGIVRSNEKWYFADKLIVPTKQYKYLGILISTTMKWNTPLSHIVQQANKATFSVITNLYNKYGELPIKTCLKIFDRVIVPILLYGSEIWGYEYREQIERVQVKFCKRLLGVSSSTPNVAVLGECGRYPLSALYMYRCITYWFNIVQNYENIRYPKRCYNLMHS